MYLLASLCPASSKQGPRWWLARSELLLVFFYKQVGKWESHILASPLKQQTWLHYLIVLLYYLIILLLCIFQFSYSTGTNFSSITINFYTQNLGGSWFLPSFITFLFPFWSVEMLTLFETDSLQFNSSLVGFYQQQQYYVYGGLHQSMI